MDEKSQEQARDLGVPVMLLSRASDEQLFCHDESIELSRTEDEDFPASINFTSGTTALPKGVVLTHRNLYLASLTLAFHLGPRDGEVYLHTLPMFHCNGWGMPYIVTALGGSHIIHQNCTGEAILRAMREFGVTHINGAPTVIQRLIEAKRAEPSPISARHCLRIMVAGAAPSVKMIEEIETILRAEFFHLYGLTEAAPLLTTCQRRYEWDHLTPRDRAQSLSRAGVPALGIDIALSGDGEVLGRSNGIMHGYYNDEEASATTLAQDWLHTGDGAMIDEDGYLVLTDRKKDMIISGGENVSSLEVENILHHHSAVLEACVIGLPHETWGEMVTALIVFRDTHSATAEELIAHCRLHLAHFKCPKRIEVMPTLPRTATGKLQKFKLRAQFSTK